MSLLFLIGLIPSRNSTKLPRCDARNIATVTGMGRSGMGSFRVLCRVCFSLARVCRLINYDIADVLLYDKLCVAYACRLRIYVFTTEVKTCQPPIDRHINRVS